MSKLTYRPDIDGLRGIAILSVVVYHFFPNLLTGGFAGVDIFFVISGYLITKIILKDLKNNQFTFWNFYQRRILRIFPALVLVFTTFLLFGWGVLFRDEFQNLGKHVFGGSFFISNFILWRESGYFDTASELKPFLNLWSLAIEEQFYLGWPLFLAVFMKLKWNRFIFQATLATLLISFTLGIYFSPIKPVFSFYLPFTRVWELMVGAIIPIINLEKKADFFRLKYKRFDFFIALTGINFILLSIIFINEKTFYYPYYWALFPTVGSACLILSKNNWLSKNVLANKGLIFIGLISYPLYLWHWPMLSFAKIILGSIDLSIKYKILLIAISFLCSYITYRYVERRIRFSKFKKAKAILLFFSVVVLGLFSEIYITKDRLIPFNKIGFTTEDWSYGAGYPLQNRLDVLFINGKKDKYSVFIGDSHTQQYWPRIETLITKDKNLNSAIFIAGGGCPPIPHVREDKTHRYCFNMTEETLKLINYFDNKIRKVIISASWAYFGSNYYFLYKNRKIPMNTKLGKKLAQKSLEEFILSIQNQNREVILLHDIPTHANFCPRGHFQRRSFFMEKIGVKKEQKKKVAHISKQEILKNQQFRKTIEDIANSTNVKLIDPFDYLCNENSCDIYATQNSFRYKDGSHLASSFVRKYVTYIDQTLI